MLVIPDNGLSGYDHRKVLSTFKGSLGIKSFKGMNNLFLFTLREKDINSARQTIYDALKVAGNVVGLSKIKYILSIGTCKIVEDITVCDVQKYKQELGFK